MKYLRISLLLVYLYLLSGCMFAQSKPVCPEVPRYPSILASAPFIDNPEPQQIRGIIYTTSDSFEGVLDYFQQELEASGWEIDNRTAIGLRTHYMNVGSSGPIFTLYVLDQETEGEDTSFLVRITIGKDYKWIDTCQHVSP